MLRCCPLNWIVYGLTCPIACGVLLAGMVARKYVVASPVGSISVLGHLPQSEDSELCTTYPTHMSAGSGAMEGVDSASSAGSTWLDNGCVQSTPIERVCWLFRNNRNVWTNMPTFYRHLHEKKLQQCVCEFEYEVSYADGTQSYRYLVCFDSMTQTNVNTNTIRRIKRLVLNEEWV